MSVIKGFASLLHQVVTEYSSTKIKAEQLFQTMRRFHAEQAGIMVAPVWLSLVSSGNTLDASGSTKTVLAITGHGLKKGQVIRFTSGNIIREEVQIQDARDANFVLLSSPLSEVPAGSEGFSVYQPMTPTLDASGQISVVEGITTVVDFLDDGSFAPTGANAIPGSGSAPLQVVASLAANVAKIQVISDVGEFLNIYSDSAGANLLAHVVLTPDEVIDVDIPAGTSIYIRNAKAAAIDDPNSILSMNFIG